MSETKSKTASTKASPKKKTASKKKPTAKKKPAKKKGSSTKKATGPGSGGARGALFVKGGKGGPGRPPVKKEQEYLDAFREACSPGDFLAIAKMQVKLAKKGDSKATALIFAYGLGKPSDYMPVDTTPKRRRKISYVLGAEKVEIVEEDEVDE